MPAAANRLTTAYHNPSPGWIDNPAPDLGDTVELRVDAPEGTEVLLRTVRDGEAFWLDGKQGGDGSWRFELPCHQTRVGYRFLCRGSGPDRWLTAAGELGWDPPDRWDFALLPGRRTPQWVPRTVWYQIFPDRFASSGRHTAAIEATDWATLSGWDEPVASGRAAMSQLYGGDLDGIVQRLDHLVDLGVGGIYLTPVFPARSNHRYDATSFDRVDAILGGDEALARLSAAAGTRGIRVMTDLTLNHTGAGHDWFLAAQGDRGCPEADFYHFTDHPDGYESWLGVPTLPKLDHRSELLRRLLYDGPDSILARYLQPPFDMAGWRIDVANMTARLGPLDLNHEVARMARRTSDEVDPDRWLVAEHFFDASDDVAGDGWHGPMNYAGVTRPIASWLGRSDQLLSMTAGPGVSARGGVAMAKAMDSVRAAMPWQVVLGSMALLGSHDTARWRSIARSDELALVGIGMLMTLPGAPTFFYGDEVGLTGAGNEAARRTMPWDRSAWDRRFLDHYRSLVSLRAGREALATGGFRWVDTSDDAVTYLREGAEERLLIRAARAETEPLAVRADRLGARRLDPVLDAEAIGADGGVLTIPGDGPRLSVWRLAP